MADTRIDDYCFPFDAVLTDGVPDRAYKSQQFANYFKFFINDGVYAKVSEGLQVLAETDNMYITIKPGAAFIQGRCYDQTALGEVNLKLTDGDVRHSRIDRVIVRADYVNRLCKVMVQEGSPAASPVAVELQRDSDAWDILLAEINVPSGASKITQANITDKRPDTTVCGWVAGAVNQIDTTTLFAQYKTTFDEFMASSDNEVETFLNDSETRLTEQLQTQQQGYTQKQAEMTGFIQTKETEVKAFIQGKTTEVANFLNTSETRLTEQLQTQQTEYNATKGTIDNWYDAVKDNIALLQVLDLDNLAPLLGCKKTTVFNGDESVLETLIQTADSTKVADRLTEFVDETHITTTTTRYKDGAAIEKSQIAVVFNPDGSITETVTNLNI